MEELYKRPLGAILVAKGIVTSAQLDEALAEQKRAHKKLGEVLISMGMASEEQITEARALQLDVAYVNVQDHQLSPEIVGLVSASVARSYRLIPVERAQDKVIIAMVNPLDVEAIDLVQFEAKGRVEPALATEWRIMEAIDRQYGSYGTDDLQDFMDEAASDLEVTPAGAEDGQAEDVTEVQREGHRAPIVRMVNLILSQAVRSKASDVHVEPKRNTVDIRYRIDGELHLIKHVPRSMHPAISSRIKIMSELDIAERRLPQDGRITLRVDGRNIDFRVSTSPTLHGERIVLRILDRTGGLIPLEDLGFSSEQMQVFKTLVLQPHGIILVTGPTGSGKTTTLYATLDMLESEHTNIMTVEDPIEYELHGINQTNVHHKIKLTFANQLRAILRQDPDIVLVGEIRDAETADVAFRAALTGHLVFTTLHCNDAPSAIARLLDMEVEPFLVSSAINGVMGQRLVRVLCPGCKEAYEPDARTKIVLGIEADAQISLYRAVGCGSCTGTGYKGRTAINETMVMNDEVRTLTMQKASGVDIRRAAIEAGMVTMREDGVKKILAGITTVDELQRKLFLDAELISWGHEPVKAA